VVIESIAVRRATEADGAECMRLFALLGHEMPAGNGRAWVGAFLEGGECVFVAAGAASGGGRSVLLGAVALHIMPVLHRAGPIGRLTALVVDESARGRGIGRALVNAAEEYFRARGCALIEVTSNKKRTDAHAFYERLGYTATSFRFAKTVESRDPAAG
jgi:ribosomal protein S18 acetylase RimI-like enzyme